MVEAAIVLPVFLTLILGLLDLSGVVFRHNLASELARRGTREAIVRGSQAPPHRTALGPQTWIATAADAGDIAAVMRPLLAGIDPADVNIRLEWPDGGNVAPNRVRCTVTTEYQGATFLLLGRAITLRATSTMDITN